MGLCSRCEKYKRLYYDRKIQQDKLIELIEDLLKTQQKILDYIEEQKQKQDQRSIQGLEFNSPIELLFCDNMHILQDLKLRTHGKKIECDCLALVKVIV